MSVFIQQLKDDRLIAICAVEVEAFPDAEEVLAGRPFAQLIMEFYRLNEPGSATFELIWLAEPVQNQVFASRVRAFFVLRKIGSNAAALMSDMQSQQNNVAATLTNAKYVVTEADVNAILRKETPECVCALVKPEKCSVNSQSAYPYYYCDVLPLDNTDNLGSVVNGLSECHDCSVSLQIIPASFTPQERALINEMAAQMSRISRGIQTPRGLYIDPAAQEPAKVFSYYAERLQSPTFTYNLLVFGNRSECSAMAAKLAGFLQMGANKITVTNFNCYDLTMKSIDPGAQIYVYPWNVNNILQYEYYNKQWRQVLALAQSLGRMSYLMSLEEVSAFFRLPLRNGSMVALKAAQSFKSAEQLDERVTAPGGIVLGKLKNGDIEVGCPPNLLTRHALIVGMPGTGKTTFSVNMLMQLHQLGYPFLAIEPTKAEYRAMIDAVPELQIFSPGNNSVSPFIINPFIPPKGIRVEQYKPSLATAFQAAFSMPEPLDVVFASAINACYIEYGWKDYSKQGDPDVRLFGLHEFICVFRKLVDQTNYGREVKGNIQSGGTLRLMNLIEQNSNIYDTINTVPIEDLLSKPSVLELNAIDSAEQKALIMALLLINICVYTKHHHANDGRLKNVLLIDEAHVLLDAGGAGDAMDASSMTTRALQNMIVEIRSYGTGILIADQAPTRVGRHIVGNTDVKVMFRLVETSEKNIIADTTSMLDEQKQYLSRLETGCAFLFYQLLNTPQMISTEDIRERMGIRLSVSNDEVARRMRYWDDKKLLLRPFGDCVNCVSCVDGCDFGLRSLADFYAARMVNVFGQRVVDKATLQQCVNAIPRSIMQWSDKGDVAHDFSRLCACTAIRLMRKLELGRSVSLSEQERARVLNNLERRICDMDTSEGGHD